MNKKLYTEKQVDMSAFLGGPIPAGFLIYRNYKVLGKDKQAYIALASTLVFTVTFFYAIVKLPEDLLDKIPNVAFSAFYTILVFSFYRNFMAREVTEALEAGATKGSNWNVAGLTIVGLIVNLVIIFGLAMNQPFYEGEVVKVKGNELYYDQSIPTEDVNILLNQFEVFDFFGADYGNTARLQLIDNSYHVTMLVDEEFWKDQELMSIFTSFRGLLEAEFGRTTMLKLESVSLSGNSKYKEL